MKPLLEEIPSAKPAAVEGTSGKGPLVWMLLRAFCLLMLSTQGVLVGYLIALMIYPELAEKGITRQPERVGAHRLVFTFFVAVFGLPMLPTIFAFFCPRSRIGWYLGAVTLWAGIFTTCGWPLAVPLLAFWYHRDTTRYSGFSAVSRPLV